jgi:4-amino-4-deoxy-L-arabinose transferase-like glycosyltransferase
MTKFLLGLLILALAVFLRLYNLTILPVFADEAIYIRWAQIMANEPSLRFLPLSDGKQPLFMWIAMFVVSRFQDPLFAGRFVSGMAGMGTIVSLFLLTFYFFKSQKAAFLAALFWAISPFGIFYDRMALVDSMLTMFGVWTLFLGVVTAKTKRLDMAMLTGFALGFAALTKSSALFFAVLLPATFIFAKNRKDLFKLILLLIPTYTIALGMYNIQRLGPNFELLTLRTKDYVFPVSRLFTNPRDPFIYNLPTSIKWLWQMGPGILLVLGTLGFVKNLGKYKKEVIVLGLWFLVPIVVQSAMAKAFTMRYIAFAVPFLFILAASLSLSREKLFQKIFALGVIFFVFHALWIDRLLLTDPVNAPIPRREHSGYFEEWTSGIGIKETAEFIKEEHQREPQIKIVVGTEGYFGTLPNGLEIYLQDTPNVIIKGIGVNISSIPNDLLESQAAGNKTYLLINNSRLRADPDKLGVKLVAAYPKALRVPGTMEYENNGPQETLYFFEVTNGAFRP